MFRTGFLSIIRSLVLYTQQWVHVVQVMLTEAVSITCMTYTYCCVYSVETPDDGQKTCPKHVEFFSKNKFQKLVHLAGFTIRIYHDARSSECQISVLFLSGLAVVTHMNKTRVQVVCCQSIKYEGWNFNSGNYLFTTDTK